ncbi:MAG TPA: class I SAM-dependent methyltransferase [Vicinamibacteria bacterium]|nr:class I SAM-dependent methyltransferase [Vicinamibacteria bacterium]
MNEARTAESPGADWVGFCCSYCGAPLTTRGSGLFCVAEGRWFACLDGVERLLPEDRRRELLPYLELYQRMRRDEGWRAEPGLPEVPRGHRHEPVWRLRARHFKTATALAAERLGPGPWRVLEVGAGSAWVSLRLRERGHLVVATDVSLDEDDGLLAPNRFLDHPADLPRAEAEMEALPFEPGLFDLVVAAGALHHAPRLGRALLEMRRVTRRGGLLLVTDSPTYERREDGEAMVARRMEDLGRRYGVAIPRESQAGYLVAGEMAGAFKAAGWGLEMHGWPGRVSRWGRDLLEIAKHGRRTARFPVLLGRRDG